LRYFGAYFDQKIISCTNLVLLITKNALIMPCWRKKDLNATPLLRGTPRLPCADRIFGECDIWIKLRALKTSGNFLVTLSSPFQSDNLPIAFLLRY